MTPPPLAAALGRLDWLNRSDGAVEVSGWLLHPDHPIDRVELRLDDALLGSGAVVARPDVAATFPAVAHAEAAGFRIRGTAAAGGALLHVATQGLAGGRAVIAAEEYWPAAAIAPPARPDAALMERVSAGQDGARFDRAGIDIAAQLLAAVRRHWSGAAPPRLLDWGCGPARATRFFAPLWPGVQPVGCDIDAEAIAWAAAHVAGARFVATAPFPPLPFADGAFDAVLAASVMTHLPAPVQRRWLAEIRRVLAPGGVFVGSVHGTLAALPLAAAERATLARRGLLDSTPDARLDGIAPQNYYRATWQTEAFTRRHWRSGFRCCEYREGGLGNWQDLVVLRRQGSALRWLGRVLRRG